MTLYLKSLSKYGIKAFRFLLSSVFEKYDFKEIVESVYKEYYEGNYSTFLKDYRLVKDYVEMWEKKLPTDIFKRITSDYYRESLSPLKSKYMTIIRTYSIDEYGNFNVSYKTLLHNRPLSLYEMEVHAKRLFDKYKEQLYDFEPVMGVFSKGEL